MKERPILFSTEMVRAILEGRKSQTRRIVKPQPDENGVSFHLRPPCLDWEQIYKEEWKWWHYDTEQGESIATFGKYNKGDILWVRETWQKIEGDRIIYKADPIIWGSKWKPSIFMPKEASRLKLKVTNIRVERVQDITEGDAIAEGIIMNNTPHKGWYWMEGVYSTDSPTFAYELLWSKINGKESWQSNPWVWVIEFEKL